MSYSYYLPTYADVQAEIEAERFPTFATGPFGGLTGRELMAITGGDYEDPELVFEVQRQRLRRPSRKSARKAERKAMIFRREMMEMPF